MRHSIAGTASSRKRLTLGVPDNRAVPAAETVAAAATRL